MKVGAWLTFLVILTAAGVGANDKLALRVSPAVAFAPATLRVQTTIEASAANRSVEIIAESEEFYRSSEMQLDGEAAPRTIRVPTIALYARFSILDRPYTRSAPAGHMTYGFRSRRAMMNTRTCSAAQ